MPTYDYCIESTGEIIEVNHTPVLTPVNWGELCMLCSLEPEDIPLETKITKLLAATGVFKRRRAQNAAPHPCSHNCHGDCPEGGC